MQPGLFISLDGIDGTGKSTQCGRLAAWLRDQGWHTTLCSDPGGTALGHVLREQLLARQHELTVETEALMFMASRAQLVHEVIRPALAAGQAVICDRFLLANVVYQGHGGGLDVDTLWHIGRFATRGLEPDLTLVLDVPVATGAARRQQPPDRIESRDLDFHERVRQGFLSEAARQPDRIRVIDAAGDVDHVQQQITKEVARVLATRTRS